MVVNSGPITVFRIGILVFSLLFNLLACRNLKCTCRRHRCHVLPLFLVGNILTGILQVPDILSGFGVYFPPFAQSNCVLTFISSHLLCTYFVSLGVLRGVLCYPPLNSYRRFFYGCLLFAPLLSAGVQTIYANAVVDAPFMLYLTISLALEGPESVVHIPLASCAENICSSDDVVLTVLTSLLPPLIPVMSLGICLLISYWVQKRKEAKTEVEKCFTLPGPLIPEHCDREQNCWPVVKFVLFLFFAWTIFAKPLTLILNHLTKTLTSSGPFGEADSSIYVCTNFWDTGNHIILFISSTLTPAVLVLSACVTWRPPQNFVCMKGSTLTGVDRPRKFMGSVSDAGSGMFSWDTFTTVPACSKKLHLTGIDLDNERSQA